MPINPPQLAYLPQHDEMALRDWMQEHFYWHKRVADKGVSDGHLDMGTFNVADLANLDDWLSGHYDEHVKTAANYSNVGAPPDLTYWDFDDPINFNNWLQAHALVTDAEKKALNL